MLQDKAHDETKAVQKLVLVEQGRTTAVRKELVKERQVVLVPIIFSGLQLVVSVKLTRCVTSFQDLFALLGIFLGVLFVLSKCQ